MKSTLPLALGVIALIVIFCCLWAVGASRNVQTCDEVDAVMTKIKVPEGMLKAMVDAYSQHGVQPRLQRVALEAALRWLSENPLRPTLVQQWELHKDWPRRDSEESPIASQIEWSIIEWQRRMFIEPEPEIPEEIKDLLNIDWQLMHRALYRESILSAFRRGQRSKGENQGNQ